jgi:hypothetical protein
VAIIQQVAMRFVLTVVNTPIHRSRPPGFMSQNAVWTNLLVLAVSAGKLTVLDLERGNAEERKSTRIRLTNEKHMLY